MKDIIDPSTWTVKDNENEISSLFIKKNAAVFYSEILGSKEVWASVQQDNAGRHKFVSLTQASNMSLGKS
jgi:hypothetical protein